MLKFLTYFYHINERKRDNRRLFHHRFFWDFRKRKGFSLEICTGRDFRFEFQRGEAGDNENSCQITAGLFFFTVYFTFPCSERWLEKRKCIATWDNNREFWLVQGRRYGFYFYEWAFVWSWHAKVHESSSSDPWWMHQYIHLDEMIIGKRMSVEHKIGSGTAKDVYFELGGKEFKIDSIEFERRDTFRSRIPFSLYSHRWYRVDVEIKQPPMQSGKGENSWDCEDDGTFGHSCEWKGPVPTWENRDECMRLAVDMYVDGVLKDAKRYGGSDAERGISANDAYKYIGQRRSEGDQQVAYESET